MVFRMSAGKLQDKLDSSSKALWSSRHFKDQVILIDWSTKDPNPPETSPITILRNILVKVREFYIFVNCIKLDSSFFSGIQMLHIDHQLKSLKMVMNTSL